MVKFPRGRGTTGECRHINFSVLYGLPKLLGQAFPARTARTPIYCDIHGPDHTKITTWRQEKTQGPQGPIHKLAMMGKNQLRKAMPCEARIFPHINHPTPRSPPRRLEFDIGVVVVVVVSGS